jgi:hypothetical protein
MASDFRVLALLIPALLTMAQPTTYSTAYDGDGMITVNGRRTLILGAYYHGVRDDKRPLETRLHELREAGFNLVHTRPETTVQAAAEAAGLMTWVTVGTIDLERPEESEVRLRQAVEAARGLPAVAFLETVDEPAWTWKSPEARVPAAALVQAYPIIKEINPHHLIYTNHAPVNLVATLQDYNPGTDIVACDIYPVNPGGLGDMYALNEDGHQGDLTNATISQVGQYTQKMRAVAGPHRPVLMVLQGFAWEMLRDQSQRDPQKILYPTYEQSRFMAFQALINGANGLVYWGTAYTPQPSPFWDDLKRVVREVADLALPLAEPALAWPVTVQYHEMGHSVDLGLQTLLKRHGDTLYLFTCNADKNPCKATLSGLRGFTAGDVVNEDRHAPFHDDALTDTWQPFDVHIYRLTRGAG